MEIGSASRCLWFAGDISVVFLLVFVRAALEEEPGAEVDEDTQNQSNGRQFVDYLCDATRGAGCALRVGGKHTRDRTALR